MVSESISSPTATVMPIAELTELCRKRGVLVLVDGAHCPGQVPLNMEELGQSGVDFFTGRACQFVVCCSLYTVLPQNIYFYYVYPG